MNAETLHDALTLLPGDLVAETDKLRQRRKKIIPWKKVLPMAACLCLILLTAPTMIALLSPKGAKEMAQDCAPAEAADQIAPAAMEKALPESPAEAAPDTGLGAERSMILDEAAVYPLTARYLPVQPSDTEGGQRITVISDRQALDGYLAEYDHEGTLKTACESYDESYFTGNQLVLLLTAKYRPSASYSGNILLPLQEGSWLAQRTGEDSWSIRVQDTIPDVSAHDVVRQHIVLELPGQLISETDSLTLIQEP